MVARGFNYLWVVNNNREGGKMKIAEHLSKRDIQKFNTIKRIDRNKKEQKTKKQSKAEELSRYDLMELMNIHRPTYKRVRGSWRNS